MTQETVRLTAPETAKWLRKALRKTFPGVKFSVTGSRGTAYGYYDVRWTGGPSRDEVDEVTRPYRGSYFDGMQDMEVRIKTYLGMTDDGSPVESGMRGIALQREVPEEEITANIDILRNEWGFVGPAYNLRNVAEMMAKGVEVPRALSYYALTKEEA